MIKRIVTVVLWLIVIILFLPFLVSKFNSLKLDLNENLVWSYKTARPFLGGWSSASKPIIDNQNVYFCGGYEWWNKDVHLIALDKTGKELWKKKINESCAYFSSNNDYLIFEQTYQYKFENSEQASNFINKNRVVIAKKSDGSIISIDDVNLVGLTEKNIYFSRGKEKNLYRYEIANKSEHSIPVKGVLQLKILGSQAYLFTKDGLFELKNEEDKLKLIKENKFLSYYGVAQDYHVCFIAGGSNNQNDNGLFCLNILSNQIQKLGEAYIGWYLEIINGKVYWPDNEFRLNEYDFITENHKTYENSQKIKRIYDVISDKILASDAETAFLIDLKTMQSTWKQDFQGWIKGIVHDKGQFFITEDSGKIYMFNNIK
jgi:hypothetical protein